eukprot:UN14184
MSVHEGNDVTKYFVSSGFAFIHANSIADVVAVEAVPLIRLTKAWSRKVLLNSLPSLDQPRLT